MSKWKVIYKDGNSITVEAENILSAVNQLYNPIEDVVSINIIKEYKCQVCGAEYEDYQEFHWHEAACLGLTICQYNDYQGKKVWVDYTLKGYEDNPTDKNREQYNRAVNQLLSFERFYGLKLSEIKFINDEDDTDGTE